MINFFVETKIEYTTQLVNILTPLIFEGIQSIYTESLKVSNESNNVLKVFQSFLKRIPKWSEEMIKEETDRIMNNSKSFTWLPDLVKATVKANIIVLTYNPDCSPGFKSQTKIDPKFYETIKINDFIHKIYIECARELWNNPYLMYHTYPALELKRNQRDTIHLIKDSIKEGIRKLLPVKEILELYLGEKLETNFQNDQFEKNITEADEKNIQKFIRKELTNNLLVNEPIQVEKFVVNNDNIVVPDVKLPEIKLHETNLPETKLPETKLPETKLPETKPVQLGGNDLESKILEIINKETNDTSSYITPKRKNSLETTSIDKDSTTKLHTNMLPKNENLQPKKENIDDKIKHLLEKNLGETDLNTSLSYRPETNEKEYQEIFSNNVANGTDVKNMSIGNDKEKDSSKSKRKFFNNYLNF